MGTGKFNAGVNPAMDYSRFIHYKNQDELRPDGPLGSYEDFTFCYVLFLKYKNVHVGDFRVLTSCQKCVSILTSWTLEPVVQAYEAVV